MQCVQRNSLLVAERSRSVGGAGVVFLRNNAKRVLLVVVPSAPLRHQKRRCLSGAEDTRNSLKINTVIASREARTAWQSPEHLQRFPHFVRNDGKKQQAKQVILQCRKSILKQLLFGG